MSPRRSLLASLVALAVVAGCASGPEAADPTADPGGPARTSTTEGPPRIDLDPEHWVTDYASAELDATTGAPSTAGGTGAAVAEGVAEPMPPLPPPTIDEGNTFVDPGERPVVRTATEPSSTFGLDVDTGSLSVGRAFLAEGQRPPTASVRTEEWVNALGADQAGPADGDVGVRVDGALAPFTDDGTVLVRVGVAARDLAPEDRPPAHLTFVVDTSGSMDIRDRLGLVQASLGLLVLHLRDDDTISIVTYSDEAGVLLEPTPVRDAETIVSAIDRLEPGGSTNLEGGLRSGYAQAEAAFDPDGTNAVILASDGVANVGLTDPDGLAGEIADRASQGIHLVTVGYGMGNYDDDLMEQVADRGDGFYAYLDTYAQAERLFRDRITSTLVVVADDAKAQVTFDPALVAGHRLLGYENRDLATEDFDDASVDAGELGAGHRVTALYELTLPAFDAPPAADAVLGRASVRYRPEGSDDEATVTVPITWGAVSGAFDEAPADLRLQAGAATLAQWLGDGATVRSRGTTLDAVGSVVEAAVADLPAAGLPGSVVTPAELLDLVHRAGRAGPPVAPPIVD